MAKILHEIVNIVNEVIGFKYGVPTPSGVVKINDATYKSLSPAEFWSAKCGVCHDYANAICDRLVSLGFKAVSQISGDGECTIVYTHYLLKKGDRIRDNYHGLPVFKFENKYYVIEGSWKDERMLGLHEFETFKDIVTFFETSTRSMLAEYAGYSMGSEYTAWTTIPKFKGGLCKAELVAH